MTTSEQFLSHYDIHGSASPDYLRACREIERACDFELPLLPLAPGPLEPEVPAGQASTLRALSTTDLHNAREVLQQALADTPAGSVQWGARQRSLDEIQAEITLRDSDVAPGLFDDDKYSYLRDEAHAERRELAQRDEYDELGMDL